MSDYPSRILPRKEFVKQIGRETLKAIDPVLQRKCDVPIEECCVNGDLNHVTVAAFGQRGLAKMSVNLLGGEFIVGDENWHQNLGRTASWDGKDVALKNYEGRYEFKKAHASVYFRFETADELKWPFPRKFPNLQEFKKNVSAVIEGMKDEKDFSSANEYMLQAHAECHHDPTFLNYWHAEIRSFIDNERREEVLNDSSRYKQALLNGMIDRLRSKSTLRVPETIPQIPTAVYLKD